MTRRTALKATEKSVKISFIVFLIVSESSASISRHGAEFPQNINGMDEKRHEGCDGRDHDAPFTNKTHACFVSTCYITRIAGDPRVDVNVRVHDSYKMATVTTCARGALELFVYVISSSPDSI